MYVDTPPYSVDGAAEAQLLGFFFRWTGPI
jgi:hypothetical protein